MNNEWFNEIIGQVQEEMERLKELSTACEKQEVYYKTMISTHEVTIGQQSTQRSLCCWACTKPRGRTQRYSR